MARVFSLALGSIMVFTVSGCDFSGPASSPVVIETKKSSEEKSSKASPPEETEEIPVPR